MSQIVNFSSEGVITRIDYDGGCKAVYVGEAMPGTATSNAKWRIKKLTYDSNDSVLTILWASKEAISFTVEWDERTNLSYS